MILARIYVRGAVTIWTVRANTHPEQILISGQYEHPKTIHGCERISCKDLPSLVVCREGINDSAYGDAQLNIVAGRSDTRLSPTAESLPDWVRTIREDRIATSRAR